MKFKEYYKRKLYEILSEAAPLGDLSQQPEPGESGWAPPQHIWHPWSPTVQTWTYPDEGYGSSVYHHVSYPENMMPDFPEPDTWPPVPDGMLPTYVHPDGSQIWIIPGPPTIIYFLQAVGSGSGAGLGSIEYSYHVFISTDKHNIVGNHNNNTFEVHRYNDDLYPPLRWEDKGEMSLEDALGIEAWENPYYPPGTLWHAPAGSPSHNPVLEPNWIDPLINPFYPNYTPDGIDNRRPWIPSFDPSRPYRW